MKIKLILAAIASFVTTAIYAVEPPPVCSAAPDFSVADAKGEMHSLSQYKGKYVVLAWFNPKCPFVKKHYGGAWLTINSSAPGAWPPGCPLS